MRKALGITIFFLALALTLAACGGGGPHSGNINGTWAATLTNTDGSTAYTFTTSFTQSTGSTLTITNFTFNSAGPCFASQPTSQTGSFTLGGDFSGNVNGSFAMTISTLFPGPINNVLTLQGTVSGGAISGTWTLTGNTGCSGNGTFIIRSAVEPQ